MRLEDQKNVEMITVGVTVLALDGMENKCVLLPVSLGR